MSTELNIDELMKEFGIPEVSKENLPMVAPVPTEEEIDKKIEEEALSVEQITRRNIERSNRILDIAEKEIRSGGTLDARKMEAIARMTDSISTASNILSGIELAEKTFDYKDKSLSLKEFEVKERFRLKQESLTDGPQTQTNNVYINTDRESLLTFLKDNINVKEPITIDVNKMLDDNNE